MKIQEQIGIRRTVEVARRFGVESPLGENLSLALGTSDLTLLELTSAYAALANQGTWMRPTAIRYVLDSHQKLLEENTPHGRQVISPELAYVITHMLEGTIERGTGVAAKSLGRPAAAKTGTTNDYSNAWFIGYTPRLSTGVWVGYDRPRSLGRDETGSRVAVPIWTAFMAAALAGTPVEPFSIPDGVVMVPVDLSAGGHVRAAGADGLRGGNGTQIACGPARNLPPATVRTEPPERPALPAPPVAAPPSQPVSNPASPPTPALPAGSAGQLTGRGDTDSCPILRASGNARQRGAERRHPPSAASEDRTQFRAVSLTISRRTRRAASLRSAPPRRARAFRPSARRTQR